MLKKIIFYRFCCNIIVDRTMDRVDLDHWSLFSVAVPGIDSKSAPVFRVMKSLIFLCFQWDWLCSTPRWERGAESCPTLGKHECVIKLFFHLSSQEQIRQKLDVTQVSHWTICSDSGSKSLLLKCLNIEYIPPYITNLYFISNLVEEIFSSVRTLATYQIKFARRIKQCFYTDSILHRI